MAECTSLGEFRNMTASERKKVNKDTLVNLILQEDDNNKVISELTKVVADLNDTISKFQDEQIKTSKLVTELVVSNRVLEDNNRKLQESIYDLQQYSRRNRRRRRRKCISPQEKQIYTKCYIQQIIIVYRNIFIYIYIYII